MKKIIFSLLFYQHFPWARLLVLFLSNPGLLRSFELACSMACSDIHWWMPLVFRKKCFSLPLYSKVQQWQPEISMYAPFQLWISRNSLLKGWGEQSWISESLLLKLTVWFSTRTAYIWLTEMTVCIAFTNTFKILNCTSDQHKNSH